MPISRNADITLSLRLASGSIVQPARSCEAVAASRHSGNAGYRMAASRHSGDAGYRMAASRHSGNAGYRLAASRHSGIAWLSHGSIPAWCRCGAEMVTW
jgi:hypothetical protein